MSRKRYDQVEGTTEPVEGETPEAQEAPILTAQEVVDKMDNMRKVYPVLNGDLYEIARYVQSVDPSVVIPGTEEPAPTATLGGKAVEPEKEAIE